MLLGSALVRRFFSVILLIIAVMFFIIYLYSVPLIKSEVYEIERNAARLALNNVYQLANSLFTNVEGYRQQALEADKQRLKAVVELAEHQLAKALQNAEREGQPKQQALTTTVSQLHSFAYDNDGYVWVADHNGTLLAHPDPRYQGVNLAQAGELAQAAILQRLLQSALREGKGFYQYAWQRQGADAPAEKLAYIKNYPAGGFVIGSGLYLDDVERQAQQRKQAAIREVRKALTEIRIAKTGYLFIFDSAGHLLAHPDPSIDQQDARSLIDPLTGRSIIDELIEVADSTRELRYKWDKPDDPGNFIYDKIALVRSLEGFGWYICATVYEDELRHSANQLGTRLLTIALISILIATALALYFSDRIAQPIKRLVRTAESVRAGDLDAQSGIRRDDELGLLAQTFDSMVRRMRSNIQTLDSKVRSRTDELERLEERQGLILDALPTQIGYLDRSLRHRFVNQGYAQRLGLSKEAIVDQPLEAVFDDALRATLEIPVAACLEGQVQVFEEFSSVAGQPQIIKYTLLPDRDSAGQVTGLLILALDISVEKAAERQLAEAQRMSAVGQLAGGLAHDFNNLLSVIIGNLHAASEQHGAIQGLTRYLNPAIRAARRGADITGRLLSFSRRQALSPTRVNLPQLLEETRELLEGSLAREIQVITRVDCDSRLYVDAGQLENALVNLALNAKDAMPQGGRIELLARDHLGPCPTGYDEPVPPGRYVEIRVTDEGSGFTEAALASAFEPFYTTKESGKGSGLGLSMVYGFTKQSRGYIGIHSQPHLGAAVSLLLPADDAPPQGEQSTAAPTKLIRQDYRDKLILLVEDDPDVRAVVRLQLLELGFTVMLAADADEAEQLITTLGVIDGLVSDIKLPGRLNGLQLAELMRERFAQSCIVLMTGYAFAELPSDDPQRQFRILRKPFDRRELEQALLSEATAGRASSIHPGSGEQ